MHKIKGIKKELNIHPSEVDRIKKEIKIRFNITPGNNICLLMHKLLPVLGLRGDWVECGTFEGRTLLPIAQLFAKMPRFAPLHKTIYGMDSFEGFPVSKHHPNDLPERFKDLYKDKLISKDHFEKAKKRTKNFKSLDHLEGGDFEQVKDIFEKVKEYPNVRLIKGPFIDTTPNFVQPISLLHLDCDLYESYLTCLNNLYKNVVNKGVIVFDEYYSHKYPGARIAIDEFFEDKKGTFEYYVTSEGHERWCFIKEEN